MNSSVKQHEMISQSLERHNGDVGTGRPGSEQPKTVSIFGLQFSRVGLTEAADLVISAVRARRRGFVVTPNVNLLTLLPFEPGLREICNRAAFQFVDGWPIVWASNRLKPQGLPERVAGSDLFPLICERAAQQGLTIALLGAAEGVADEAARRLRASYPSLNIVGTYCPPMEAEFSEESSAKMRAFCNTSRPDILVLGMGIPKQEKWIAANIDRLDIGLALCFGGVIDFAAGKIQRAPRWVVGIGMEWLWRLFMSPRQYWKRTLLRFPLFFPLFLRELMIR